MGCGVEIQHGEGVCFYFRLSANSVYSSTAIMVLFLMFVLSFKWEQKLKSKNCEPGRFVVMFLFFF